MDSQKFQINMAPGATEATVRVIELNEDKTSLPILEPLAISLNGTIGTVYEYLTKRLGAHQFDQKNCHILVNRDKLSITLVTNETDHRDKATISGSLAFYPKYIQFGINSGKIWEPVTLSKFLKLNRAFFPDVTRNMELVSILKNFKAIINQQVARSREDDGSRTDNFSQVVDSNLPKSFVVAMPIFKGRPVEQIEVELLADVDGREVKLALCSPGAEVIVEEERNKAIDEQLTLIRALAPDIAIIEQ